jgi:hypothetical protein
MVGGGRRHPIAFTLGCAAMISDEELRKMSREDRTALSRSLAAIDAELPSLSAGDERRRLFVVAMTIASACLIPWIVFLAITLPRHYVAGHWRTTWVGFDIALLVGLALTALLAWRRRQAVVIAAFVTATLLSCDAWFDITTASGTTDTITSVASAVILELPLSVLLFAVAYHFLRLVVRRAQAAHGRIPGAPIALFRLPLFGVPGRPSTGNRAR